MSTVDAPIMGKTLTPFTGPTGPTLRTRAAGPSRAPMLPARTAAGPAQPGRSLTRPASQQLPRFIIVGMTASASYALVFLLVGGFLGSDHVSNVAATLASTVLANELHRRFTFRGAASATVLRSQSTGAVTAAVGLVASTAALTCWHHIAPNAGPISSIALVYAVTGAVGLANFVALRVALRGHPQRVR